MRMQKFHSQKLLPFDFITHHFHREIPPRNCDRLDVLVLKVPVSQRSSAKVRVDQLKYDARHLAVRCIFTLVAYELVT